ncbi:MAG: hypothetical protein FD130_2355 [Halothiobacillaceae bacterium]|nr:MAG: hypothetical protein FD130_2355 [Halothiobacillaceae bacterium]
MKDLVRLAIYLSSTIAVIYLLIYAADASDTSTKTLGMLAIFAVVLAPVAIIIFIVKRKDKMANKAP